MSALLVLTTFPDIETARRVVHSLVSERLIACGNLLPAVESIYHWNGTIEKGTEVSAFLKTTDDAFPRMQDRLTALHPYQIPEVIALPISTGLPSYLAWIRDNLSAD